MSNAQFERAEREILAALQEDGRLTNAELAGRIGLSESPTFRRVKRLEEMGVIRGYSADVDQRLLGLDVTAFVQVTMEKQPDEKTQAFHAAVAAEPHIIECHAMSGAHDYLMKVVARSIDHFSDIVMKRILSYPGVQNVESSFSLRRIKVSRVLPTAE